jgi:hypothetical protein
MEITSQTRWRALFEMAAGAGAVCLACLFLLFFTDLGEGLPDALKIGIPVGCWVLGMWFFFAHRSPDGKSVTFKVW